MDRYHRWLRLNPEVTPAARADQIEGMIALYRLDRFGETGRYHLYRRTWFAEAAPEVQETFDRLLDALARTPDVPATQRVELSDLQAVLQEKDDRRVFSRMVFPRVDHGEGLEVLTYGEEDHPQVTVRTRIHDRTGERYAVREPVEAEEVGRLYRLFFQERFPKTVSERDRYLIATDRSDRVVAGIVYRMQEPGVVQMDGVVVTSTLQGRGIATALLEDFVTRIRSGGVRILKTNFLMRRFCERRGFRIDRRWGGLVRFLDEERDEAPLP